MTRSWAELLPQWLLIETDLHEVYGIDVGTGILRDRPWRWFKARVYGLLVTESRLARHFAPPPDDTRKPRRR
ncbi:hypothetical protein [Streptomyces sp. NPDC060194]|uniref:hypothetical protein n=1 Tax=Streptomyces sp. NPDC060194 TaxID=3347069 RepID=UPI003651B1D0